VRWNDGRKRLIAWALVLGVAVLAAVPATGSVRSQALYARGLIPFNNGQWDQAYRLFDQAVRADPKDALALYYRGLTQARRGAPTNAIKDFEDALQLRPTLPHAALDLGIAYFDAAQYAAAKTWLERAHQQPADRFAAALFLGLTLYRMGDDAAAIPYFNDAKADPELRPEAQYYAGLALLRQGKTEAARTELGDAAREYPQSEVGRVAQRYTAAAAPMVAGAGKPWSVYGRVGFEYDSNVVAGPDESDLKGQPGANAISREGDGRAVVGVGGGYTLVDADVGSVRATYDFSQSIHFKLTDFDLQGHRVRVEASSKPGVISYGIAGTYDFYLLDYQSFYQEILGTPWVTAAEGKDAATQVYYTIRGRDFLRSPYNPIRDGTNNAFGIRQYIALGDAARVLDFGYQFDAEDPISDGPGGRQFKYKGHQIDVGVSVPVTDRLRAQAAYLFRLENYQFPNFLPNSSTFTPPPQGPRRHDAEHQFVVAMEYDLTTNLALLGDFVGTINGSNIPNFEYDRYIVSASVQVTF